MDRIADGLAADPTDTPGGVFGVVANAFMHIGGTSGPLFGMLFTRLSRAAGSEPAIGLAELAAGAEAGLAGIQRLGGAAPGDKTMIDALDPAVAALQASLAGDLADGLEAAAAAARAGADATAGLIARRGRASYVGEAARGVRDPGALTVALLFEALAGASKTADGASLSRSAGRLRSHGEGPREARPTTPGDSMPKYLLLKHYRGGPEPHHPFPPMDQWAPEDVEAHMAFQRHVIELLQEHGEYVDAQALTPTRTWVRYGGEDAAPVTTDGPHPETSDLIAGWYMIDVDSRERAHEIAAYVSSEPGPRGEPLYEWIDVREIMSGAPSED